MFGSAGEYLLESLPFRADDFQQEFLSTLTQGIDDVIDIELRFLDVSCG